MTADGDRGRGSLEGGEDVPELEGGGAVKQVTFFLIKKKSLTGLESASQASPPQSLGTCARFSPVIVTNPSDKSSLYIIPSHCLL